MPTGCEAPECGTLEAHAFVAVDRGAAEAFDLEIVGGDPVEQATTWSFEVRETVPPLEPGVHCLVVLTSILSVTGDGSIVGTVRADSAGNLTVGADRTSRCDLLAGVDRIDGSTISVVQRGDAGQFGCGAVRLRVDERDRPMVEVSGCDHDTLVWLVRLDSPELRALVVPAGDTDTIRRFPVTDPPLAPGVWQPILVTVPGGFAVDPSSPDLAMASWPPVQIAGSDR